jgi:hypothetical protein
MPGAIAYRAVNAEQLHNIYLLPLNVYQKLHLMRMNLSDLSPVTDSLDNIATTTSKARKVRGSASLSHNSFAGQRARPASYAAFRERLLFFHLLFASCVSASRRKRNNFKARRLSRRYARRLEKENPRDRRETILVITICRAMFTHMCFRSRHRAISRGQVNVCVLRESRSSCRLIFTRDWISLPKLQSTIVSRFSTFAVHSRVNTRCNVLFECCSYVAHAMDCLLHFCDFPSSAPSRLRINGFRSRDLEEMSNVVLKFFDSTWNRAIIDYLKHRWLFEKLGRF